jgi:homoserine O-acetyltransferase/O-succinyltransferase
MQLASETETTIPAFEVVGAANAPVVVVLGGISATRHVCSSAGTQSPGWWEALAGTGKAIDTRRYRIASFDFIDGGADADGYPARVVTTHDQAAALAGVLDVIGVDRVHAIVGASYGGMVALAFAEQFADRLDALVVIGAAHVAHPMSTALRSVQRQIVELGVATGRTRDALAIARALAMTTYRSAREFSDRFTSEPVERTTTGARFPVEQYLRHRGARFADTWSASRFLALSLSADLHRVDPTRITTPTLVVAAEGDAIVPLEQSQALADLLGGRARLQILHSRNGHDAFLTEARALTPVLSGALSQEIFA